MKVLLWILDSILSFFVVYLIFSVVELIFNIDIPLWMEVAVAVAVRNA